MRCLNRDQPKVNIQLLWINLPEKPSWSKITATRLSYDHDLDLHGEEKSMENGIILIKMGITHL